MKPRPPSLSRRQMLAVAAGLPSGIAGCQASAQPRLLPQSVPVDHSDLSLGFAAGGAD